MGVVFLYDNQLALLRPGSWKSRPFGVRLEDCRRGSHCEGPRKLKSVFMCKEFKTTTVTWECVVHGPVQQMFTGALDGWWATEDWHIALWKRIVSPQ
jgi:hypothetical protein